MSIQYDLSEEQFENVSNTLIITGSPRSGTSIFGQAISTLGGIEYNYEPQIVPVLMRLLEREEISKDAAFLLLRMHLHEDLLLESAHGRKANLRPNDMSLVLNSIPWKELLNRWNKIDNTADALEYIAHHHLRLAIKTVSVIHYIPTLREALPRAQFALILRDGRDVVSSLLQKNWLTDEALKHHYWPHKIIDGHRIPDRIPDEMASQWAVMSPATRACYLWRIDAEHAITAMARPHGQYLHVIRYENFLNEPEADLSKIATFLSSRLTDQTHAMIRTLRPYRPKATYEFLSDVAPMELKKFNEMREALGY